MKILVTGSNGMVGKNIIQHSFFKQHQLLTPSKGELDLTQFDQTLDYFSTHKPDFIIHAAGLVGGIHANMKNPVRFLQVNTRIGENVFLAAKECNILKAINLASSCMYPRNCSDFLTEDLILKGELEPTNEGYALAKIWTYRLCKYIHQEDSFYNYKTLIPCNLYGPHDKFDPSNSHLLPAIIHKIHWAIKNNDQSVEIWGDGTARREFMAIGDLVSAVVFSIQNFENLPMAINVGLGYDYSINDYYKKAADIIGYSGTFYNNLHRPVGMKRKLVSVEKMSSLGWSAKISLDEGILQAYKYYLTLDFSKRLN